jgi:hypothetical protein
MVNHLVMWRLAATDESQRAADAAEIRGLLEPLRDVVPGVRSLEVGVNGLPGDKASDLVLITSFDDWTGLRDYGIHPEHVEVAARIRELTTERRSVDYESA